MVARMVVALVVAGMAVAVTVGVVAHTVVVNATNRYCFWRSTNQKRRSMAALPL